MIFTLDSSNKLHHSASRAVGDRLPGCIHTYVSHLFPPVPCASRVADPMVVLSKRQTDRQTQGAGLSMDKRLQAMLKSMSKIAIL